MPKVYLSGPMSGLPKYNYPAFYEAAMKLRLKGVEVLSPAEGAVTHDKMWSDYMRRAIKMLCDCDFNVRLPGWVNSTGARLETQIADALCIINIDLHEMLESLHPDEMEASKLATRRSRRRKRKELREYALDCKGEMNRNYFICHLEPDTVLNLLDTIEQAESRIDGGCIEELKRATELAEQAEARAERAEKELAGADAEITELRDELEDSRGTEKDAPNILCAIARLVGVYEHCQELGDDMGEMTLDAVRDLLADKQTAEAENVRLTKMVDWLAEKQIRCAANGEQWYGPTTSKDMYVPMYASKIEAINALAEAARRAVAAGEG